MVFLAVLAWASESHAASTLDARFTVADSIEMRRIVAPEPGGEFQFSPDGQRVLIVTARGNLQSGDNDFAIDVYSTQQIRAWLSARGAPPESTRVAQFSSATNEPAIADVRWLADSRRIAFRAEGPSGRPRLYACDVSTGRIDTLVEVPGGVWSYDIVGDTVIYTSRIAVPDPDIDSKRRQGFRLTDQSVFAAMAVNMQASLSAPYVTRVRDLGSGREIAVSEVPVALPPSTRGVWLSPDGKHAVAIRPYRKWSKAWADYAYPRAIRRWSAADMADAETPPPWIAHFVLIDVRTGAVTTLVDAPTGELVEANPAPAALWSRDSSSIVLVNTLLAPALSLSAAIVEVDRSGNLQQRIAPLSSYWSTERFERVAAVSRPANDTLLLHRSSIDGALPARRFRARAGGWRRIESPACDGRFELAIEESLNTPPDVVATDCRSGRRARLTDLNPSFRERLPRTAEVIEWTDARGRVWKGGLLRPVSAMPGKRYPLVIQSHGFWPERFLLDGSHSLTGEPFTTGYAARALAARDMFVLQMEDHFDERNTPAEAQAHQAGFEAAVGALSSRFPIDTARVGLMGFSRSGYYVQYTLAHSSVPFAAAVVADPLDMGYVSYLLGFNAPGRGRRQEYEALIGCAPFGACLERWRNSQPTFNIDAIHSPVRLEAIGPTSLLASWELYAGLRSLARPVEMSYLPNGVHVLTRPWERRTSQQGALDWFQRWLSVPEPAP
jgi:dipeptidyl aminopeptidase/acylaminoacyl peptidase